MTSELKPPSLFALCQTCSDAGHEESCYALTDVRFCAHSGKWLCEECFTSDRPYAEWKGAKKASALPDVPELVRYDLIITFPESNGFNEKGNMRKDKSGKYVRHDQAAAVIAAKDALLETANSLVTCCCGSDINGHGIGDGHSPVSQYHYALYNLENRAEAAEAKLAQIEKQDAVGYVECDSLAPSLHHNLPEDYITEVDVTRVKTERFNTPLYAAPVASDADLREKLSDPTAILINMMRGEIAKPEFDSLQRIYPEIADLRAENDKLREIVRDCLKELDRSRRPSYAWQLKAVAALNPSEPRT